MSPIFRFGGPNASSVQCLAVIQCCKRFNLLSLFVFLLYAVFFFSCAVQTDKPKSEQHRKQLARYLKVPNQSVLFAQTSGSLPTTRQQANKTQPVTQAGAGLCLCPSSGLMAGRGIIPALAVRRCRMFVLSIAYLWLKSRTGSDDYSVSEWFIAQHLKPIIKERRGKKERKASGGNPQS